MAHANEQSALLSPIINQLAKKIIAQKKPDQEAADFKEGKFIIFMGGGRVSGKTTLTEHIFNCLESNGYKKDYVGKLGSFAFSSITENPLIRPFRNYLDRFAKYSSSPSDDVKAGIVQQLMDRGLDIAFAQNSPIIIDNHMDNKEFVDRILAKAREHGYETIMLSPHIDAEDYFKRAEERRQRTGRPFDPTSGLITHKEFAENLDHYFSSFDLSILLSNKDKQNPLKPIAVATPDSLEVLDEELFRNVKRKAGLNIHARSPEELYPIDQQRSSDSNMHTEQGRLGDSDVESRKKREIQKEPIGKYTKMIADCFIQKDCGPDIWH